MHLSSIYGLAIAEPAAYPDYDEYLSPTIAERQSEPHNAPELRLPQITYSFLFERMRDRRNIFRGRTLLFYTRRNGAHDPRRSLLSIPARQLARGNSRGWRTIWDGWPGSPSAGEDANGDFSYYAISNPRSILRGIQYQFRENPPAAVPDSSQQSEYFRRMSAVYALQARGNVVVMTENPRRIRMDGIWGMIEYPILTGQEWRDPATGALRRNTGVERIYATNENGDRWYLIWDTNDDSITPYTPSFIGNNQPDIPRPPSRMAIRGTEVETEPAYNFPEKRQDQCQLDPSGFCQGVPVNDPEQIEAASGQYYMEFFG